MVSSLQIHPMMPRLVRYRVVPMHPEAHLFEATCTVDDPDPLGQRFALPAWIPGSYLIRDFARHIVGIRAQAGRRSVRLEHLDKHTWMVEPVDGSVSVTMQGKGLGGDLLLAAGERALAVAQEVGGVALAIDAKDERAATWYERFGALRLFDDPLKLVLPLETIAAALKR